MPHEIDLLGVYLSPFILVTVLAVTAALLTAMAANGLGWSNYVGTPPWAFLALVVIYACLFEWGIGA